MRIGLNILYLIPGGVGGTETYARHLISALTKQLIEGDELVIYASRETAPTFNESKHVKVIALPIYSSNRLFRLLAEQLLLPLYLLRDKVNVIFSLGYSSPFIHPCPAIVTIHDLNWYYHPEDFGFVSRIMWSILTRLSAHTANHVITDSDSSARSIKEVLKTHAVTPVLHATPFKTSPTKPNFKLPDDYLFTVSASYPHKNLTTLIKVFNQLASVNPKLNLVICGLSGKASTSLKQEINNSPFHNRIIILGYITNHELSYVYSRATVFVFPSAYEGFGYPVLEAMSYGIPVVSSNATSLKEVVGHGGMLVEPYDIPAYISAISKILKDSKFKQGLIKRGEKRATELQWDHTAINT
ncbi:MAG: glycosyltransferase family 1 protein, partial [Candidatus Moraniibacteriota bacterium]